MMDASCSAQCTNIATDTSFHCFLLARARAVRWPIRQRRSAPLPASMQKDEQKGHESKQAGDQRQLRSVACG